MAEDKKTFLQGKMNQDIDDRILPNGEYRSAQNIQITTSEGSDVGAIQNILGNSIIKNPPQLNEYEGLETIGSFFDEKNNTIFYFVTNYTCPNPSDVGLVGAGDGPVTAEQQEVLGTNTLNPNKLFCGILKAVDAGNTSLPSITLLVEGLYLNFSKTNTITGVNLLDNLLFWTDDLNQPRKINIDKPLGYYDRETKVSVAKFAPFMPPLLLEYDTTTLNENIPITDSPTSSMETSSQNNFPEDFLKEKFVRFSYRYKFEDGEYSTIAPFTQICFIPKTTSYNITQIQKVFKKGEVYFQDTNGISDGMVNDVTAVNLNIILPSKKIKTDLDIVGVEILYKESDNNLIKAVELEELNNQKSSTGVFQYKYKSTLPYKTLPQDQTTRIYDNVPLSAKAQEIVSNRVVYGNYVENRELPNQKSGAAGLNFIVGSSAKYDTTNFAGNSDFNNYYLHKEYPFHSIKQRRTYEVGVVLADKFGRQSPVLTSTTGLSSINIAAKDSTFNSSSWDYGVSSDPNSIGGIISNTSPGNENYCGDALTITFNESIPNAYATGSLVPINNQGDILNYEYNLYQAEFFTEPTLPGGGLNPGTGESLGNLYYYSNDGNINASFIEYIYTNSNLTEVLTGYEHIYLRLNAFISSLGDVDLYKITLDVETGQYISHTTISLNQLTYPTLIPSQNASLVQLAGNQVFILENATTLVDPLQQPTIDQYNDYVYEVKITNFSQPDLFKIGDYLKGQDVDFVKIKNVVINDNDIIVSCDGPASLSYKNFVTVDGQDIIEVTTYAFYTYKLTPHGWYSYRVVVKQPEQEYYNVYTPGAISFDNDRDEDKTYIPITSDNINKITRDKEFTNTREVGLSTSKNRVYPKVIPDITSSNAASKQSNLGILDVVSIGTAKEQGLTNDNEDVFNFVYETSKNPLMAQLPYGSETVNIGKNVNTNLLGTAVTIGGGGSDVTEFSHGNTVLTIKHDHVADFHLGTYLKGANQDLVKITSVKPDNNHTEVTCDGEISEENKGLGSSDNIYYYIVKYNVQDALSVFETKPFESVLDIYYETSTAGLVHELNEAVSFPTTVKTIKLLNKNLSEGVEYFSSGNVFNNEYVATLQLLDQFENELIQGSGSNQIQSCEIISQVGVFHEAVGGQTISVNDFEIVLDENDNRYKIKPNSNFVYYPPDNPVKYNLQIKVVNQNNESVVVYVNNLELANEAPNLIGNPNSLNSIAELEEVIYSFNATNGSSTGSTIGLKYQDASLGSVLVDEVVIGANDPGNSIIVQNQNCLFNANTGEIIDELQINNDTGDITLTSLFDGSLSVNVVIRVFDSDDIGIEQGEDPQVGGMYRDHNLSISLSDGLMVVESSDFENISSNLVNGGSSNQLNIDIFNQNSNELFNNYWTRQPDTEQSEQMEQVSANIGTFLFSTFVRNSSNAYPDIRKKLYSLVINNNQPEVHVYTYQLQEDPNIGSNVNDGKVYANHWLANGNGGIIILNSSLTLGGVISEDEDIDGGDNSLLSIDQVDYSGLFTYQEGGNHELYGGTAPSFKVYGNGQTVSTRISKPKNRTPQVNSYIIKAKDVVSINNVNYNILYEVQEVNGFYSIQELTRVFLCRDLG